MAPTHCQHWARGCIVAGLLPLALACEPGTSPEPRGEQPCGQGLTFYSVPPPALLDTVFILNRNVVSQLMIRGRSQQVPATHFTFATGRYAPAPAQHGILCSSDSTVIRISNDSVLAVATGLATIYAFDSARRADSITIEVTDLSYDVIEVGRDIGDSTVSVALSNAGDVLAATPDSYFLWHDGAIQRIESCTPTSVNVHRQVSCREGAVWEAGSIRTISIPDASNITTTAVTNDGAMVGQLRRGGNPFAYAIAGGDTTYTALPYLGGSVGRSNDNLEIVANVDVSGYRQAARLANGSTTILGARYSTAQDISSTGLVVGRDGCEWRAAPAINIPRASAGQVDPWVPCAACRRSQTTLLASRLASTILET